VHYYDLIVTPDRHDDRFEEALLALFDDRPLLCGDRAYTLSFEHDPQGAHQALKQLVTRFSQEIGAPFNADIQIRKKRQEDWVQRYQQSIQPVYCGPFYIRPPWHPPQPEQIDLIIDPGLVFGTGHHETTCACLTAIAALDLAGKQVLDVGCGSGILGIAAAKREAIVSLCDSDEAATIDANKHAALNSVTPEAIWIGSADQTTTRYDVVIANIVTDVLIAIKSPLCQALASGGFLVLSGVLPRYEARLKAAFGELVLVRRIVRGEWLAFVFQKLDKQDW
jgi:ribosomal protein L11 methyltransferase